MKTIRFGDTLIEYAVVRSRRRQTVRVEVSSDHGVVVRIPQVSPDSEAADAVRRKARWIHQRLALLAEIPPPPKPKEFVEGETFLYLGRQYRLRFLTGGDRRTTVKLLGRYLTVTLPVSADGHERRARAAKALERWYRDHARRKAEERIKRYATALGIRPGQLRICSQKYRWGSCSRDGTIRVNWRIVMAPLRLFDYVVVHELCHLKERNHTRRFWSLLETVLPDWDARRERLRQMGSSLEWR